MIAEYEPCRTPPRPPTVSGAPWRGVSMPSPAASTPTSSTSASSANGMNVPIAFEPPPTHAITRRGDRLLERAGAGLDRGDARAQQLHPLHVGLLAADVLRAHVDDALEPEQR